MYETFYGLKEKPFNTTADPKFLYLTEGHREALAHLLYGVQERRGFIVLTGEVGTGKTTLIRALLQQLDDKTEVAFISQSKLSFDGLLEYMLAIFGIANGTSSQAQRLFAFNHFLAERQRADQNVVLILDEAQNLEPQTLEQIRLLSNYETPTTKLLQLLLVGQPELQKKLRLPELRQLKQRIGLSCSIVPLALQEIRDYICHRLRVAGALDTGLFTDRAMTDIGKYTGGNQRLVNIVCDHCLIIGYGEQKRQIDHAIVARVINYLHDGKQPRRQQRGARQRARRAPRWSVLALVLLTGLILSLYIWKDYAKVLHLCVAYLSTVTDAARDVVQALLHSLQGLRLQ